MLNGLFIMSDMFTDLVYPKELRNEIGNLANIYAKPLTRKEVQLDTSILQKAEIVFSGWGGPKMDKAFLEAAPHLKAMFYAAGTIKHIVTEDSWNRNITITTSADANAVPVAEYTLSQVLFTLKGGWQFVRDVQRRKEYPQKPFHHLPGAFNSTVGIISLSTVGRKVAKLLKPFNIRVLAYDPYADKKDEYELGVELTSLSSLFRQSDVVSLHAPLLPATKGMITGDHLSSMKEHASFINTARGAIVNENEMLAVLKERSDITAILDVTEPEPPAKDSLIYTLPNVVLTPHIAGSEGKECGRLGTYMLEEFKRYIKGEDLRWRVTKEQFDSRA